MKIDVLAVLDTIRDNLLEDGWDATAHRLDEVRVAVSELIEADRDYDDAQFGLARAKYNGDSVTPWAQDLSRAEIRRAVALSNIGEAK